MVNNLNNESLERNSRNVESSENFQPLNKSVLKPEKHPIPSFETLQKKNLGQERSRGKKIADKLNPKYVKVETNQGNIVHVRLRDLKEKTGSCAVKIILKSLFGTLNENSTESKIKIKELVDTAVEKSGSVRRKDKNKIKKTLKKTIRSTQKMANRSGEAHNSVRAGKRIFFIDAKKDQPIEALYTTKKVLGRGGFGEVRGIREVAGRQLTPFVQKASKYIDPPDIINENAKLTEIHNFITEKYGADSPLHNTIQSQPHRLTNVIIENEESAITGYMIRKYDYDLNSEQFFKLPLKDRAESCQQLLSGLQILHSEGYVHGDLKSANCCSFQGNLQLCDFGGVRKIAAENKFKTPEQRNAALFDDNFRYLGIHTSLYTSEEQRSEELMYAHLSEKTEQDFIEIVKAHDIYTMGLILLSNLGDESLESQFLRDYPGVKFNNQDMDALVQKRLAELPVKLLDAGVDTSISHVIEDMLKPIASRPGIDEICQRYATALTVAGEY